MARIIQLFERPTLAEYQAIVQEMYDTDPAIYLLMAAFRDDDDQYDITYVFYADSSDDFRQILEKIIEDETAGEGG